jgi:arylsulfatase
MNRTKSSTAFAVSVLLSAMVFPVLSQAADKTVPNIVVIMGDDIG